MCIWMYILELAIPYLAPQLTLASYLIAILTPFHLLPFLFRLSNLFLFRILLFAGLSISATLFNDLPCPFQAMLAPHLDYTPFPLCNESAIVLAPHFHSCISLSLKLHSPLKEFTFFHQAAFLHFPMQSRSSSLEKTNTLQQIEMNQDERHNQQLGRDFYL